MARTYETTELQDRLAERLAATEWAEGRTFAGKWWGRGDQAERFYFGDSARTIRKNGKPVRAKVWLQFDDPATLEGVSLRVETKKAWHKNALADWHAEAVCIAIELIDPEDGARLRAEIAARRDSGEEPVGSMVGGEDE